MNHIIITCFQNYGINLFVCYHKCLQPISPEDEGLIDIDVGKYNVGAAALVPIAQTEDNFNFLLLLNLCGLWP